MPLIEIYCDQNVFGHMLDHQAGWRQHPLAVVLREATERGEAAVWLSPSHIIELSLCSDITRRRQLAEIMLELIAAKRMWYGCDYFLVEHFGAFLNSIVPDSFQPALFFNRYRDDAALLWLGYLGLMSSPYPIELGPALAEIRRSKLITNLIHARIAADPDVLLKQVVQDAEDLNTTTDIDPQGIERLSDQQILSEIDELRRAATRPKQRTLELLKKNRAKIAARYGAVDIGFVIGTIFRFPCDLELTFNTPALVRNWPAMQRATGCEGLPREVVDASDEDLRSSRAHVIRTLNHCIEAAALKGLTAASVGYYSLMKELERRLNQKDLPKPSIAIDVDHALSVLAFKIMVCRDRVLNESLSTYARMQDAASVVYDEEELKEALKARVTAT